MISVFLDDEAFRIGRAAENFVPMGKGNHPIGITVDNENIADSGEVRAEVKLVP
jgi:hypothetical protein